MYATGEESASIVSGLFVCHFVIPQNNFKNFHNINMWKSWCFFTGTIAATAIRKDKRLHYLAQYLYLF